METTRELHALMAADTAGERADGGAARGESRGLQALLGVRVRDPWKRVLGPRYKAAHRASTLHPPAAPAAAQADRSSLPVWGFQPGGGPDAAGGGGKGAWGRGLAGLIADTALMCGPMPRVPSTIRESDEQHAEAEEEEDAMERPWRGQGGGQGRQARDGCNLFWT
jgi:hypothetical protein